MKKRWKVRPVDSKLRETLVGELGILPVTAQLLINRGLVDCDRAFSFLRPEVADLHDPFLMKGMEEAVRRIAGAIERGELIAVYGDYDVDGTASSAMLHLFFRELGVDTLCYIPERQGEGYGLNRDALTALGNKGVRLVITVDCGTSNPEEVAFAGSIGMDVIVTDHHEVCGEPPRALAFINPRQPGCGFPFKGLAGVGVAFNLLIALRARLRESEWFRREAPNLKRYLDLVSIGTVADMVPLTGENRVFVSHGLVELRNTRRPGLLALMDVSGVPPSQVNAEKIAFQIAPRLNAAGRLERAATALKLLVTEDPGEAARLSRTIDDENTERRAIERRILDEALAMVKAQPAVDRAIALSSPAWHSGVIGIVASRMVERFARPAVLIATDGDMGRGSVRGIKGCDVTEALKTCSALLDRFGGHRAAAGLTVREKNLGEFKKAFIDYFNGTLTDDDLVPEVMLDCVVSFDDITERLVAEIDSLSPFGRSNEKPLLCATGADVLATRIVGERHLKMALKQGGRTYDAIAFNMAVLHPLKGNGFDVAFHPYVDRWGGTSNLRLSVKDVKHPVVPAGGAVNTQG